MKFIEKHIKLRSIVKKWGLIKKLKQKIFLLTDKNWNVRKKISRISVDWRWPRNSTKQLYWLFTKKIIAQTTSPTSLSRLTFYPRLTVIYILVFLPSVVYRFIKKNPFLYQNLLNLHFFKKHFINNCKFSRGEVIKFLEGGSKSSKMSSKISDLFQWDFTYSKLSYLAGELFFLP